MSLLKKHESKYICSNTGGDRRFYSSPFGGDIQIFAGALKWEIWTFNQTQNINYIEPPEIDTKPNQEAIRIQRWKIWPEGKNVWATGDHAGQAKEGVAQQKRTYAAAKEDKIFSQSDN